MKKSILFMLIAMVPALFVLQSCDKDSDEEGQPEQPDEYIADDNSFANFMSWPLDATTQGADPALGMAHAGNDSTVTRNIYFKDGQDPVNGIYPVGSIIVKHTNNPSHTVNEFTAMVKRGNDYNTSGGDWEWFMLNPDGTIATDPNTGNDMRGADLMGGMCLGCHTVASSKDYVFSK